jgi:hypothetical protein
MTKFDFKIISIAASGIIERKAAPISHGQPQVTISSEGLISLSDFTGTGVVRLFDLNGKVLYRCPFNSIACSTLRLHKQARLPKTSFIVRVSRSDGSTITGRYIFRTHRILPHYIHAQNE